MKTTTFRLFGIPVWSVTVSVELDEEALYKRMSERFKGEIQEAFTRVRNEAAK